MSRDDTAEVQVYHVYEVHKASGAIETRKNETDAS